MSSHGTWDQLLNVSQARLAGGDRKQVALDRLSPNPDQPRKFFAAAALDELVASIKAHGLLQPLLVRPHPIKPGQFQIVAFPNEAGLEAKGDNLYLVTPSSGEATLGTPGTPGYGTILQGVLESSNVNVVAEITDLISAQRAYEMNSKVIKTADEMASTINQMS